MRSNTCGTMLSPRATRRSGIKLWEHQERAYRQIRESFASGNRRIMVQSPTGSGKTVLAMRLIRNAIRKGQECYFTVPKIQLVDQTCDRFMGEGYEPISEFGVIQADHEWYNRRARLQICSAQTLGRRIMYPERGIAVIDEAHVNSEHLYRWMKHCPETTFIGLSATPWTKGLARHWDDLIIGSTTRELINKGILCDFRVYAPSAPDLERLKTVAGDYQQKELSERSQDPKLVASIVDTWIEKADMRPTLVFAVDRMHAATLQRQFQSRGIPAGYVDAYTEREDRDELQRAFHAREIPVVVNVGVLTTGTDWDVRCVVLARATKSEMLYVQMVGRGLRTNPDGEDCLILDHADNHARMGFVTDIHYDELDAGEPRKRLKDSRVVHEPKPCPKCKAMMEKGAKICPACGHERSLPPSEVAELDGSLQELRQSKAKGKRTFTAEQKQEIWAELKFIANEKGYSDGWVWHTIREMCGSAPRRQDVQPKEPSQEVRNFVKYKMIRMAKSRQKQQAGA